MKRTLRPAFLPALLCCMGAIAVWAETPLPAPYPESRYDDMSARSPFAVATATAAATAAPTPGFAAQLYVDGAARIGTDDMVVIKSRDPDQTTPLFLTVGGTSADGMKVDHVNWSAETGKTTVEVSKAGEKATLEFDEQTMKTAAQAGPPPGVPGVRLPMMPGQPRPINFPPQNAPPVFNHFYPRQPGMAGPPGVNLPQSVMGIQRRRVRGLIQSGQ